MQTTASMNGSTARSGPDPAGISQETVQKAAWWHFCRTDEALRLKVVKQYLQVEQAMTQPKSILGGNLWIRLEGQEKIFNGWLRSDGYSIGLIIRRNQAVPQPTDAGAYEFFLTTESKAISSNRSVPAVGLNMLKVGEGNLRTSGKTGNSYIRGRYLNYWIQIFQSKGKRTDTSPDCYYFLAERHLPSKPVESSSGDTVF